MQKPSVNVHKGCENSPVLSFSSWQEFGLLFKDTDLSLKTSSVITVQTFIA